MSVRMRAAAGGALLALAVAPAAHAAKPANFRITGLKISDSSVAPGDTVRVTGRAANAKRRKAASARVIYALRTSKTAKTGKRLGSEGVQKTRGGRSHGFAERVVIPSKTKDGTYYLTVCVNRAGSKSQRCSRRRLNVATPTPPAPPAPDTRPTSEKLRTAITADGMLSHLKALQAIADDNGGNRASGLSGYGGSVQYVLSTLRAAGYNPTTQVFDFVRFSELSDPVLEQTAPAPRTFAADEFATMDYSPSGDVTAPITPVDVKINGDEADTTSGCEDADFAGFPAGNIALIQRGVCTFQEKVVNAQEAGAAGAVIFNQGNDPGRVDVVAGTLGDTAQDGQGDDDVDIPATGISYALGKELAQTSGAALHMQIETENTPGKSTNVIADTPTGLDGNVILVGSHLDSVPEGPGINDNGSGSAYNLELAVQMAKQGIKPVNKVRFAWWGAEEAGLVGSNRYGEAATDEQFAKIAANLNFDMLASPNHAKLIYDGDFSDTPAPAGVDLNEGSARIESLFKGWFDSTGQYTEPTAFDGRSDYQIFQNNGIAAGGLFSGAEVAKSADQAAHWGGTAGQAFDPNYHHAGDNINNLDLVGYKAMTDAADDVVAKLAENPDLRGYLYPAAPGKAAAARKVTTRTRAERVGDRLAR
jgi:Zn-dependent M28 family amino/carboxypeptidase